LANFAVLSLGGWVIIVPVYNTNPRSARNPSMPDEQTTTTTTVKASPPGAPPKVEVTTVTSSPMLRQFGNWTAGIIGAFISGAASAVSGGMAGMIVDNEHFNFHGGLHRTLALAVATAVIPGIVSLAKYLSLNPIPRGWDGVDRRNVQR
jgi:hypothetical protein